MGGGAYAHDQSRVTMNNCVGADQLLAYDNSQVTINGGGTGDSPLAAYDNSQVTVNGGYIHGDFYAYDNSRVAINGGRMRYGFSAYANSQVTMTGGYMEDSFAGIGVRVHDNAHVTLFGSDFAIYDLDLFYGPPNLVFSGYGDLTSSFFDSSGPYSLSGILANGDRLDTFVWVGDDAVLSLVPVPGAVLLGVLGLGYAGYRLRRHA